MVFQQTLHTVIRDIEGAISCLLMGSDGLLVDAAQAEQSILDAETLAIEYTGLLREMRALAESSGYQTLHQFTLRAAKGTAVFHFINADYFLLLSLDPSGNVGKAQYLLQQVSHRLREQLEV